MNPKKLILIFGSVILFCSCKKDDTVVIFYTVASEQVYRYGAFGEVPYFVVKEKNDSDWKVLRDGIQGFDYERGYEYRVSFVVCHLQNAERFRELTADSLGISEAVGDRNYTSVATRNVILPIQSRSLSRFCYNREIQLKRAGEVFLNLQCRGVTEPYYRKTAVS